MSEERGDKRPYPTVHVVGFLALFGALSDVLLDAPPGAPRHVMIAYIFRGLIAGGAAGYFFARAMRHFWAG